MYEQPIPDDISFYMLYGAVAMMALMASCYLMFRRANAFAPNITPPVRLRRWTAAFFAGMSLSHLWYLPVVFQTSSDDIKLSLFIGTSFDFMILFPMAIIVMLVILQDRKRPLWPVPLMMAPAVIGVVWCIASQNDALVPVIYAYLLLLGIGLTIYIVRALRQYGRWLRDNYADLEHKEVWQSFVVIACIMLLLSYYVYGAGNPAYEYIIQICAACFVCYLLWRVETLSDLTPEAPSRPLEEVRVEIGGWGETIEPLLQQFCIDTQLYLQHDLTLQQLAKVIGTNRFYLSQYFSSQGLTYNAYINKLRLNHFISLYREAVATERTFTVKQLAHDSGYRSYSTFSLAFKQLMGQNVTTWMNDTAK